MHKFLQSNINLIENNARYHNNCYAKVLSLENKSDPDENKFNLLLIHMAKYFEDNLEECQFTFKEICDSYEGDKPEWSTYLKKRIQEFFNNDVVIHFSSDGPIFSYRNIDTMLSDRWERKKEADKKKMKKKLIQKKLKKKRDWSLFKWQRNIFMKTFEQSELKKLLIILPINFRKT